MIKSALRMGLARAVASKFRVSEKALMVDAELGSLGMDSLDISELFSHIEKQYRVALDWSDFEDGPHNLSALLQVIERKLAFGRMGGILRYYM